MYTPRRVFSDARQSRRFATIEWRVATYLSQDQTALSEIVNGIDLHEENRVLFNLPERRTAKIYLFRLIYGGSAYSYANDPDFMEIGNESFWEEVIDKTYQKYMGLSSWHNQLVNEAMANGKIIIPSGREYAFTPEYRRGEAKWPRTKILNYPVQGLSADIMSLVRVALWKRISHLKDKVKLIATVHDDIRLDIDDDEELLYNICTMLEEVFKNVPQYFEKYFKVPYNVPMMGEVSYGTDLGNLKLFDKKDFE